MDWSQSLSTDRIPDELRQLHRFVLWKRKEKNGQWTKIPYSALTGFQASTADPDTWTDFSSALERYSRGGYDGIGLVLGEGYVGLDMDHCREAETGEIEPWALRIVDLLQSYTEISPSRKGLHIIVKASLPECRSRFFGRLEVYDRGRYFTMTGESLPGTPSVVHERDLGDLLSELRSAQDFLDWAQRQAQAEKIKDLWDGKWPSFPSQSEADLALCHYLSSFAHNDPRQTDRLFRLSRLYRAKWDERRSGDGRTYGELTISKALGQEILLHSAMETQVVLGGIRTLRDRKQAPRGPQALDRIPLVAWCTNYAVRPNRSRQDNVPGELGTIRSDDTRRRWTNRLWRRRARASKPERTAPGTLYRSRG